MFLRVEQLNGCAVIALCSLLSNQGQRAISAKGQTVSIVGFAGQMSLLDVVLSAIAAISNPRTSGLGCVSVKLCLQKQALGGLGLRSVSRQPWSEGALEECFRNT